MSKHKQISGTQKPENAMSKIWIPPFKVLKNEGEQGIRYVYHISDVHIRCGRVRYSEYSFTFNELHQFIWLDSLNSRNNSLIVITGDIVESKLDVDNDLILYVMRFFKMLLSMLPVIVIPGNHDVDVFNRGATSVLDVIRECIGLNNFFYLKKSGIYQFQNIFFSVTSIIDNHLSFITSDFLSQEIVQDIKQKFNNVFNISLFHGQIKYFKNNSSESLDYDYRRCSIKNLDGFDCVLLGDAHKFKFLNEKKTIAYAGSLIQQDSSEEVDRHGVLKWILNSVHNIKTIFVPIDHMYSYYCFNVTNGDISHIPFIFFNKSYLRIRFLDTSYSDINRIRAILKKRENVCKVAHIKRFTFLENDLLATSWNDSEFDYYQLRGQQLIIKSYLKGIGEDRTTISRILRLHELINDNIIDYDHIFQISKSYVWKILELRFSNTFCYGEKNLIHFKKFKKNFIIGLTAPNGLGKSSIFDVIVFVLFNRLSSNKRIAIMNNNSNECFCSIKLDINGTQYYIVRSATRTTSGLSASVNLYIKQGDRFNFSNGHDAYATNRKIESLVGTYDDFISSFIISKDVPISFLSMSSSDLINYLMSILDINLLEKFYDQAIREKGEITDKLKKAPESDQQLIAKLKQQRSDLNLYIKVFNKEGLPFEILRHWFALLERKINAILAKLCDLIFIFDYAKDTSDDDSTQYMTSKRSQFNVSIKFNKKNTSDLPYLKISGFETFCFNFAFREAIIHFSNRPRPNFFFIDEAFGCVDFKNRSKLPRFLRYLRSHFDYPVIINHIPDLNVYDAQFIDITTKNGYSYISNTKYFDIDLSESDKKIKRKSKPLIL